MSHHQQYYKYTVIYASSGLSLAVLFSVRVPDIGILTYYADQKLLHIKLLSEAKMYISTVDAWPSIMKWPNEYFYNGELRIHESLRADNEVRSATRKISQESYGIKGPDGCGSEYWQEESTLQICRKVDVVKPGGMCHSI